MAQMSNSPAALTQGLACRSVPFIASCYEQSLVADLRVSGARGMVRFWEENAECEGQVQSCGEPHSHGEEESKETQREHFKR